MVSRRNRRADRARAAWRVRPPAGGTSSRARVAVRQRGAGAGPPHFDASRTLQAAAWTDAARTRSPSSVVAGERGVQRAARVDDEQVARRRASAADRGSARARSNLLSTSETSSRTSSRLRPRASGGSAASSSAGRSKSATTPAAAIAHPPAAPRIARRARLRVLIEQPVPERHRHLGQRTIGDVFERKRLLVHARAHVARIDEHGRHAASRSSAASVRVSSSSAALLAPYGPQPG